MILEHQQHQLFKRELPALVVAPSWDNEFPAQEHPWDPWAAERQGELAGLQRYVEGANH